MGEQDCWSSIGDDIVLSISTKIDSVADYIRFSAVCKSWHSSATDPTAKKPPIAPSYMSGNPNKITLRRNPNSDQTLTLTLTLESPEGSTSTLWGSPFGWLIAFDLKKFTLLNPFSGSAPINLPSDPQGVLVKDSPRGFLTLSPDSDPENCTVVIVSRTGPIALFKPCATKKKKKNNKKDMKWTYYKGVEFKGVTYFRGHLYGIQYHPTRVVYFDHNIDRFVPVATLLHHPELRLHCESTHSENFLFELDGQLCLCVRYYNGFDLETEGYKFFEINLETGMLALVTSLGGRCVFINPNYCFTCKARYPPNGQNQNQSIYNGLVSDDYVFYCYEEYGYDSEVWDVSRSCIVLERKARPSSDIQTLWIVPPMYKEKNLIRFN